MRKRERVGITLAQREPDRVPTGEISIEAGFANRLLGTTFPDDYQHYEHDRQVREEIVACGFEGLHSLQPSAGMDIAEIKRRYGKDLTLIGNIDLDYVMTMAPPSEVEDVVKRTIDAVPPANALAMYETAHRYGVYGKGMY